MFTAIDNLSSMAVDKEVLRDKKQASINSHKIYPNDLTIGSINAGMFDHSPVAVTGHPIKKSRFKKGYLTQNPKTLFSFIISKPIKERRQKGGSKMMTSKMADGTIF